MSVNHIDIDAVSALISSLGSTAVHPGGAQEEDINAIERALGLHFPASYREFLRRYGALSAGPINICGLVVPWDSVLSLVQTLIMLRATNPHFPLDLMPIEELNDGRFACLRCSQTQPFKEDTEVVIWNPFATPDEQRSELVSPNFSTYLYERLAEWKYREPGLKTMEYHVRRFEEEYLKLGKLPRNHVWRPYRFCVQDVVIGLVVVCHSLENNCLEVDVCLTSDVPEYEPDSGAKMTSVFLLSEAYKCGGTMEIRFSEYVEGGRVPAALCRLARGLGVDLNHVAEGRITPSEARQFYMALTGFSPHLRDQIVALSRQGRLSQERACYVVHHGVWTRPEVESIVFGSQRPDSIFSGDTLPEQRHLYIQDILHARAAILGGFLDRKLARRERVDGDVAIDLEDDTRRLDITFDPGFYAKIYQCDEDLPVPWLKGQSQGQEIVPAGHRLVALVRAREVSDSNLRFQRDLKVASELVESFRQQSLPAHIFILTPRDFEELPPDVRDRLLAAAILEGVGVMVCPETVASLDADASRRLTSSRILRQ